MSIDYRELLTKYMRHVVEEEGWSYTVALYEGFTVEEIAELRAIAEGLSAGDAL